MFDGTEGGTAMAHRFFKYCIGLAGIVALSSFFVPEQAIASQLFPEVVLSSEEEAGDALKNDVVCLDISQGDIYISSEGYSREDDGTLTAFEGVYRISGNSREDYGIYILDGSHTVILDDLTIDQRTLRQCCPMIVGEDCDLTLYLHGDNVLFAGAGYSGLVVRDGASVEIQGFGLGSIALMAYPENTGEGLVGTSAIDVEEDACIQYPETIGDEDEIDIYTGDNRLSPERACTYNEEPYLQITYSVSHRCTVLSPEADCTHSQYCLECGREVRGKTPHIIGSAATCTEGATCSVCGETVGDALGHRGVWKLDQVSGNGRYRREVMICTVCHETLYRTVDTGENK